jgi:hypothetical protein
MPWFGGIPPTADDLRSMPWSTLVHVAQSGQEGYQMVSVEIARRFTDSIDVFRKSADQYSRWLFWLTVVLVALTLVLAVLTGVLAYKALYP